ncbi:hypothetical protein Q31b_29760 [Novipirellula aureliae]|uniref:Zinc-finger domain-containing protein n=1 Tax=Novipirellula aureliae TaxID=2527966 RepID=A0A5C6E0P3_9BACT|nr:hypothetical protein [Novipirellula aureliae]TWU41527.1 hypothetical protein Q31b_29760 [Novipirellula aureliae]
MNCDDFLERLQDQIDRRQPIDQDRPLLNHAAHCDLCRGQLFAWQQINQIMPTATKPATMSATNPAIEKPTPLIGRLAMSAAMIAAAVMFAFSVMTSSSEPSASNRGFRTFPKPTALAAGSVENHSAEPAARVAGSVTGHFNRLEAADVLATRDPAIDASQWIRSVRERQWIDETMPTVHSLRDGVAPLGRSLIRAVTILTTSSAERPS